MQLKRGRLIDHLHLRATDLEASRRFYTAILGVLGIRNRFAPTHFFADELWVDAGATLSRVHFAFQVADRAMVERWYAAGLAAGGRDNGAPGERPYHPGYYAAFLLVPTATMSRRCTAPAPSADAVVITT